MTETSYYIETSYYTETYITEWEDKDNVISVCGTAKTLPMTPYRLAW